MEVLALGEYDQWLANHITDRGLIEREQQVALVHELEELSRMITGFRRSLK
jgi:hypothetical protein